MKKHLIIALVLVFAVIAVLGQTATKRGNNHAAAPSTSSTQTPSTRTPSTPFNSERLLGDVKTLADDSMEGRGTGTPGGLKARAYVVGRFKDVGLKPFGSSYEQPFKLTAGRGAGREGANVVGYIGGKSAPHRYLVVSAHYDHLGVRGGQVYNGADDNASGVAALLAVAEYFSRHRPENSLIFVAFDAEELGLVGAREFVKTPPVDIRSIVMDVNLDMVSHSDKGELYATGAYHSPFLKSYLERVAAHAHVKLLLGHDSPDLPKSEDWTTQSDHAAFHLKKIPFIYFGVEDHKDYHKPTDDYTTITPDFFIHATEAILDSVKVFDAELATIEKAAKRK